MTRTDPDSHANSGPDASSVPEGPHSGYGTDARRVPASAASGTSFTLILVGVAVGAIAFVVWMRSASEPEPPPQASRGEPAPPIVAEGWLNGDPPTPETFRNRVVVLEAWASWCGPCRLKAPYLIGVYEEFLDRDVVWVGLTPEDARSLPQIRGFLEQTGVPWLIGYGALETLDALDARWIPAIWVIGRDGHIVWSSYTPGDLTLEEAIRQALDAD